MICDICKKYDEVHYRVVNAQTPKWIFICKKCWQSVSKTKGYKYGGTRKGSRRKKRLNRITNRNGF